MTVRRDVLRGGLAGGASATAALAAAGPALAQAAEPPPIRWRMTSSYAKTLDAVYGAGEVFIKTLADITKGRIQLQHFAAGELVPGLQALDAVQNGTVECCDTAAFYYVGKDPTFAFAAAVPFGLSTRQQNAWFFQGGGLELLNEFFAGYDVVGLPIGNTNAQMAGWFRREIKGVEDLSGLKFRVGGLAGRVVAKLGAAPQQIAPATSTPPWRRARSTRRSGSAPTTTRSSASRRWRPTTTIRAGGRGPRRSSSSSTRPSGTSSAPRTRP